MATLQGADHQLTNAVSRQLEQIKPRFLQNLAQRLDRFEALRIEMDPTQDLRPYCDELRAGAHSTAGLAAPLGFPEVGETAGDLERILVQVMRGTQPPPSNADILESLDAFLGEMAIALFP
jgi:chemotaxis protein histidine kinase CheA